MKMSWEELQLNSIKCLVRNSKCPARLKTFPCTLFKLLIWPETYSTEIVQNRWLSTLVRWLVLYKLPWDQVELLWWRPHILQVLSQSRLRPPPLHWNTGAGTLHSIPLHLDTSQSDSPETNHVPENINMIRTKQTYCGVPDPPCLSKTMSCRPRVLSILDN